jgi:hypothetical protein
MAQGKILDPDARLLRPLPIRVLRKKLFIGIRCVGGPDALPLLILGKLRDARTGLRGELAIGVTMEKVAVTRNRVRRLRGTPVLLLAAATAKQGHRDH